MGSFLKAELSEISMYDLSLFFILVVPAPRANFSLNRDQ